MGCSGSWALLSPTSSSSLGAYPTFLSVLFSNSFVREHSNQNMLLRASFPGICRPAHLFLPALPWRTCLGEAQWQGCCWGQRGWSRGKHLKQCLTRAGDFSCNGENHCVIPQCKIPFCGPRAACSPVLLCYRCLLGFWILSPNTTYFLETNSLPCGFHFPSLI